MSRWMKAAFLAASFACRLTLAPASPPGQFFGPPPGITLHQRHAAELPAAALEQQQEGAARSQIHAPGRALQDRAVGRHDRRQYRREVPLSRARQGQGAALRHRHRPDGFEWSGTHKITRKARVAGLDAAGRNEASASPTCPTTCPAASTTRSAPAPSISARRSTASTAPTSPGRSAAMSARAASAWSTTMSIDLYERVKIGAKVIVL